jgi:hypothetical protein
MKKQIITLIAVVMLIAISLAMLSQRNSEIILTKQGTPLTGLKCKVLPSFNTYMSGQQGEIVLKKEDRGQQVHIAIANDDQPFFNCTVHTLRHGQMSFDFNKDNTVSTRHTTQYYVLKKVLQTTAADE